MHLPKNLFVGSEGPDLWLGGSVAPHRTAPGYATVYVNLIVILQSSTSWWRRTKHGNSVLAFIWRESSASRNTAACDAAVNERR